MVLGHRLMAALPPQIRTKLLLLLAGSAAGSATHWVAAGLAAMTSMSTVDTVSLQYPTSQLG